MKMSYLAAIPTLIAASLMPASAQAQNYSDLLCVSMAQDVCTADSNYLGWGDFTSCAQAISAECMQSAFDGPDMSGMIGGLGFSAPRCFVTGRIDAGTITDPAIQCS